ncbi:MAG: hypothetical protein RL326_1810 [Pseudomonadota bacterium]|jgi:hypothetical protein
MKRASSLVLSVCLIFSAGCSLLGGDDTRRGPARRAEREGFEGLVKKKTIGVEVTWEAPSEPTDGFVIRYGEDKTRLLKEVIVASSELREENDPQFGPVYRYTIKDVSHDHSIFVSIAAFRGDTVSDFSDVMEESKRPSSDR